MANNLIISYDLIQDKNYDTLIREIKTLGGWAKINYSVWFVSSNYTAQQAMTTLGNVMDANDKLFVVDARSNTAAWRNLDTEVSSYIRAQWNG